MRIVGTALVVAAWTCAGARLGAQQRDVARYLPSEVDSGGRLYQSTCTGCHGPEGDGVAGVNFSKGQFRRAASDDDLVRIMVRGIAGTAMPPSGLSDGQAGTIVAYLRAMNLGSAAAASLRGVAGRGRLVVEGKGRCLTCHSIAGAGARTGPNLTEIGRFRRAVELERSLVNPGTEVRAEDRTVRIVTRDGTTITGRLLNQDTFSLQLIDSHERLLSMDKASLREYVVLKGSAMPSYRETLDAQERADVVSYLETLRGQP